MKNVWLIIQREYLTRVKKKTFLLTTFGTPLLIVIFGAILVFILGYQSDETPKVMIKDDNALVTQADLEEAKINAELTVKDISKLRFAEEKDYLGVLHIPRIDSLMLKDHVVTYYSDDAIAPDIAMKLERMIAEKIRKKKISYLNYDEQTLETLKTSITLRTKAMEDDEDAAGPLNSGIAAGLGIFMGMIMYFSVSIYGSMVMRGVMEEKINRIVEVMVSSVKPFELMLGKVLGIGAVGMTQLMIWMILVPLLGLGLSLFMNIDPAELQAMTEVVPTQQGDMQKITMEIMTAINTIDWYVILPSFLIYYFCGYLLYAALFAAVGSMVGDDMGEAQSLTVPIMLPIMFGIYIMISAVKNPTSPLAVWSSMVPFFSPMVMPARLAFNPPMWQLFLSIAILIASVIGIIWLSARIYRVGILMYGKKATFKEIVRWLIKSH